MYKLTTEDFVIRLSDGLKIYPKSGSKEGNEYLEWILSGGNPLKQDRLTDFTYQRLRAAEYPPMSDFADAYYWMQKGKSDLMDVYVARCEAVKQKYPK